MKLHFLVLNVSTSLTKKNMSLTPKRKAYYVIKSTKYTVYKINRLFLVTSCFIL